MRHAVLVAMVLWGCDRGEDCVDPDEDDFGEGCDQGPDCDEGNPLRNADCDAVAAPDCDSNAVQPGCPCFTHREEECYLGPPGTEGLGLCASGVARCLGGHWGLCVGATQPADERCDGEDDDCDGAVDDGVESPCGGCDDACIGGVVGQGGTPFDPEADSFTDTQVAEDGAVVLTGVETATRSLWVANSGENTVSRLDTSTGEEVARYPSGGVDPSRTAVDYSGDAYVANRAFGGQATVEKIAGDEDRCEDRDLDGRVETSHGPDEVLSSDECVLWTADVGAPEAIARALAVDGDIGLDDSISGNPWVGLHAEERVIRLDPLTGELARVVDTPGVRPYGAAIGPGDVLWVTGIESGQIARIDTRDPDSEAELVPIRLECTYAYGIAVDARGRVWLGGWSCGDVRSYDPEADAWSYTPTDGSTRGVAVDDVGLVWAAHTGGTLSQIDPDQGLVDWFALDDGIHRGLGTVGVAVDSGGRVWAVSQQGGDGGRGLATRVDPADGSIAGFAVGLAPYTYSDMTGNALRRVLPPEGTFSHVFTGCPDPGTRWIALHFEALTPAGASIELAVRHAAVEDDLPAATFESLAEAPADDSPVDLDLPEGGVVEVGATLRSEDLQSSPRLTRLALQWTCAGPD